MKYLRFSIPIAIFLISLGLRFYHLSDRFVFTADEEYQATYARTIVQDFHPVWIGVSAADTGFYLGPYFTYFTALWLSLSQGDPLITGYIAAIMGAITSVILYYLGKEVGGKSVGLAASTIYSFSPLMVYFDQRYWNPSPIPLLTCLLLLALLNFKSQKWWLVVIAFCLGAFWHVHLSLVPLTIIAMFYLWHSKKQIKWPTWIVSGCILLGLFLPLLIFDYNHDWSNLTTPLRMANNSRGRSLNIVSHIQDLGQTIARFAYLSPGNSNYHELTNICQAGVSRYSAIFSILALFPIIIYLGQKRTWQDERSKIVALAIIVLGLPYVFYPGSVSAYYALGLIPLYFILIAIISRSFRWVIVVIFILLSSWTLLNTKEDYGLSHRRQLITEVITELGNNTFSLEETGSCLKYGGWRYLFLAYGRPPSTSSADSSLLWLYPNEVGMPGTLTAYIGAAEENISTEGALKVLRSGGYSAVIVRQP